jgi:hypothetical protein
VALPHVGSSPKVTKTVHVPPDLNWVRRRFNAKCSIDGNRDRIPTGSCLQGHMAPQFA